jgi:hypothetical protein
MITETVLEMHYHKPIMDLIRSTLGLGTPGGVNFYKYSPQKEAFIGFDQAYVTTDLSEEDFFAVLRNASMTNNYQLESKYIGFFLQFKVVKEMKARMRYAPSLITNRPHYRVSLDTTRNINTGVSQHELLYNLKNNPGALVFYACPMIFDRSMLYEVNVDLSTLRLADVRSCPSAYTDNDNHFVYFNDPDALPVWCSEPVEGKAIDPESFVRMLISYADSVDPSAAAGSLLKMLTHLDVTGVSRESNLLKEKRTPSILPLVGETLTIVKVPIQKERGA